MVSCLTKTLPWQTRHSIRSNVGSRGVSITPAMNLPTTNSQQDHRLCQKVKGERSQKYSHKICFSRITAFPVDRKQPHNVSALQAIILLSDILTSYVCHVPRQKNSPEIARLSIPVTNKYNQLLQSHPSQSSSRNIHCWTGRCDGCAVDFT